MLWAFVTCFSNTTLCRGLVVGVHQLHDRDFTLRDPKIVSMYVLYGQKHSKLVALGCKE